MQLKRSLTSALRLLATLAILLTGVFSTVAIADASPTVQEAANGELWSMGIGASIEGGDPPASIFGAQFTVTSEDGDYIGGCTLEQPERVVPWWNCRVDVPSDRISLVWEDPDSIPAGYAPVENPIVFDPTTYETGPHNIGAFFRNVPIDESTSTGTSGSADPAQRTWDASVQVNLCDAPPNSGREMNCHGEAGIVVNISFASGELLGSCTTGDPQPTPWGVTISTCSVDGMPFNADIVATQDPSTIPTGYTPSNDRISLRVDDLHPGGGDQATFTFFNIGTDAGSGSPTSPSPASSETTSTTPFTIWATSCDNAKGGCWDEVGAHFTVTTEEGESLGECTLEASSGTDPASCSVPVPVGMV
ncbi:MAG: hypothetical protein ACR2OU_08120, partial [Thermomicrobiales bacterium]